MKLSFQPHHILAATFTQSDTYARLHKVAVADHRPAAVTLYLAVASQLFGTIVVPAPELEGGFRRVIIKSRSAAIWPQPRTNDRILKVL